MPSLLLLTFIVQLFIDLISQEGAVIVQDACWSLYLRLPNATSKTAQDQSRLRQEYLRIKKEMNSTSSQDEFARWAKLRRQHDKVVAELEGKASSFNSSKANFVRVVTVLRWVVMIGLRIFMQVWYKKQPVFWIPRGWFPGYVERLLAFPQAPTGSISIQVWAFVCKGTIALVEEALRAVYQISVRRNPIRKPAEAQKIAASGGVSKGTNADDTQEKRKSL
ncbi:MAG: GET complex subunit get1 [Sclerophora amabilis]|nr:MAG: GET complex subunit get1 [Sclerophora amabilis]